MFYLLHGIRSLHRRQTTSPICTNSFTSLKNEPLIFRVSGILSLRWISTSSNKPSITISYLINKLGLSPESAQKAAKYLHLKTPENADTVVSVFEKHGFSKSQIKTMVRKVPKLLAADIETTILPKLEFFHSKGFSNSDLAKFISNTPSTLHRSLERQIIPFFNTYSNLINSDEKTVRAMKAHPFLISYDMDIFNNRILPNMNILRDHGVPESNLIKMLYQYPSSMLINPSSLKEVLKKVEGLGLDPLVSKFIHAVYVLSISMSLVERKVDAFRKWGWSEKEIWECFKKYPGCFAISEDKIMAKMDFLVNKMSIDASRVVEQPSVLTRSFQKRIVPRGLVAQHLIARGLIKDFKLSALFDTSEENFLKMFITRHVDEAPELVKLYKENLKI